MSKRAMIAIRSSGATCPGRVRLALLLAGCATPLAQGAARAAPADAQAPVAPVVRALIDCRKDVDATARLKCYDEAASALATAEAAQDVVVINRAQITTLRRQAFGFSMPTLSLFHPGPKDEGGEQLTVVLASARHDGMGKLVVTTTEDATWRQIDDIEIDPPPKFGDHMSIRHAMLGSFFCKDGALPSFRCTRER